MAFSSDYLLDDFGWPIPIDDYVFHPLAGLFMPRGSYNFRDSTSHNVKPSTAFNGPITEMVDGNSIDKKTKKKKKRPRKKKSKAESELTSGQVEEDSFSTRSPGLEAQGSISPSPSKVCPFNPVEVQKPVNTSNIFIDETSLQLLYDGPGSSSKHSFKPQEQSRSASRKQPIKRSDDKDYVGDIDPLQYVASVTNEVEDLSLNESQNQKKVRKRKNKLDKIKKVDLEVQKSYDESSSCCHYGAEAVGAPDLEQVINTDGTESIISEIRNKSDKKKEKKPRSLKKKSATDLPPKKKEVSSLDNQNTISNRKSTPNKKKESEKFEEYLSDAEIEKGLKDKTMVKGSIRINQRCYKEAYLSEGDEKDIIIKGVKNRNRAFEGDEVVVLLDPAEQWKPTGQRTGKVVRILEEFHSRSCIGKLPAVVEPGNSYIVFSPRDPRVPRVKVAVHDKSIPSNYLQVPHLYSEVLFNVKITSWPDVNFAEGTITAEVGKCGDVEGETLAIMIENVLDPNPINPLLSVCFPSLPYTIPEEEIAKRLDLRKECIFTIDPATARDLDDAVSVKELPNGNLEVGVHISDVSFFLTPDTLLDQTVSKRATTVYLVQRVYHMLPVELCHLCSLTSMEDKLAFSVFVELTPDAQVVSHSFARSVINSCTKLAYEHAQMVIDNPEKTFTSEDFPEIGNGFTAEDCVAAIRKLYKLSVILRKERFDSGALRIDQPKLCFHLDPDTQSPLGSFIYENKESHRLIEEFMLLANMVVAKHIYTTYPDLAFLRHHQEPRSHLMLELQTRLEQCGIHLDISDAGTVHSSIRKYSTPLEGEDTLLSWARFNVLNNLCAKTMQRAKYFCPTEEDQDLHHYALNAPYYTHFTSPIRRYADIMVHRLLAASLGLAPQPSWTVDYTKRIARICNHQKYAAKLAGEQSSQLFLALFLNKPVESDAAVLDVKDRSFDVIIKDFGVILRVYTDPLPVTVKFTSDDKMKQLHLKWKDGNIEQYIQLFSVVRVLVSRAKDGLKLSATLLRPLPEDCR